MLGSSPSIASTLRARRKKLGLTQQDAAELAGVSVRFVHDCESGKASVQLDRVLAFAAALGLTLSLAPRQPEPTKAESQPHEH
ncbi:HipB antitoxin [Pontimonas salivibrio]|uniref:HipB antitoxin n=1 Tax=Pontimonas salivibrio TaxID=1159327 RepID=A0A2L2BNK8_9MICO|nr:helix-turn-helix transcriptional regulator [Pontimonas salivibrio]AVG23253.1 HipB antitoxin [Pontimonas salivibrio]